MSAFGGLDVRVEMCWNQAPCVASNGQLEHGRAIMHRYSVVGLGFFLGVAVACTGNGTASAPAKQPAELPGSDLSVTQALKAGNLMFVVLCEAQDDPRVATGRDDGTVEAMQSFRVVMALDVGMRTGETLRLRYWCHRARGRQERTVQKGERVIWFVGITEKDDQVGIKAMDHTLENQLAATRPQAHLKLPVSQWGQAVEGLQCGIDPRGNAILLAVTNVSPKPVSIGYLMKTDKEGVLPTPSLTLEMKDSEGQFVPRINSATAKISGPGIALNPGWFCVHFFDVRQYFAVKESGQYLLTARIEKFPVRGPQTQIHTISLVSGEATLLVDMAKPQTPAEGPRVHAFAPRGEAAPATQSAIQPAQPETAPVNTSVLARLKGIAALTRTLAGNAAARAPEDKLRHPTRDELLKLQQARSWDRLLGGGTQGNAAWPSLTDAPELRELLLSDDPGIRGLAVEALASLKQREDVERIARLMDDTATALPRLLGVHALLEYDEPSGPVSPAKAWAWYEPPPVGRYAAEVLAGMTNAPVLGSSKAFNEWWQQNRPPTTQPATKPRD